MTKHDYLRRGAKEAMEYLRTTGATEQMRRDDQYYVESLMNYVALKLNLEKDFD